MLMQYYSVYDKAGEELNAGANTTVSAHCFSLVLLLVRRAKV